MKYSITPIKEESNFYHYKDDYVFAVIATYPETSDWVGIYEWSSNYQEKGGTKKSLQNIRKLYKHISVHDIGLPGDDSYSYWKHMKKLGLVDDIYDDDMELVKEGVRMMIRRILESSDQSTVQTMVVTEDEIWRDLIGDDGYRLSDGMQKFPFHGGRCSLHNSGNW